MSAVQVPSDSDPDGPKIVVDVFQMGEKTVMVDSGVKRCTVALELIQGRSAFPIRPLSTFAYL